jgi:hypothetical protein
MALDPRARRVLLAAVQAALEEPEPRRRRRLPAKTAILLGAGVVTAARIASSDRGRDVLGAVRDRVSDLQGRLAVGDRPDVEDEELDVEPGLDDGEPEDHEDEYEEPDEEYDEDEAQDEYEEEPEEYDGEEDEEPSAEEEPLVDEEELPAPEEPARGRTRSRSRGNRRS